MRPTDLKIPGNIRESKISGTKYNQFHVRVWTQIEGWVQHTILTKQPFRVKRTNIRFQVIETEPQQKAHT